MTTAETYALLVPVGLVLYAILRNRLAAFVQPLRVSVATTGEEVLTNSKVPTEAKEHLAWWMDRAYSESMMLKLCVATPIASVLFFWTRKSRISPLSGTDAKTRKAINILVGKIVVSQIASAPILGPIFLAELTIVLIFIAICGGSFQFFMKMLFAIEDGVAMRGHHA
jgi:hypothetical protein